MASTSDGGRTAEIEFSSMKQPPLIKQLKGILSEYPDGGQILKEVIQNAEDAEAVEVQIVYNGRRINDTTGEATPAYNRFFKGPSLCIYNDAVFAEKDWDGIRMIYSSVKEDDPLTVGRFGLGFKSVFHITDYPCVISGDKMLLIDPQQSSDKVNAMVNLEDIEQLEHKGLNAEAFWVALDGMFGFNRDCVQRGYFRGTIFWFPLREKKSEISETLYDEEKVLDLFDGFQTEASSILLFLKNLQRISVCTIGDDNQLKEMAETEIDDTSGKLKQSRAKFKEKIKLLASDYKGEDITVDLQMTIRTTINGICECAQWQVVNYFVGNSASSDFKRLILDEDLGYSPYVGVASPLNEAKTRFEGHVFCFLPLPREGSRLTGLPVHVNGFFALSQNRHHLKWETDEQKGKKIDDKNILWNKYLIKEALPRAYSRLIQCVVDVSNTLGNTEVSLAVVYNCLPLASSIENKWRVLETELYKKIKKLRVLYSKHKNKWVTMAEACFASFDNLPENHKHVQNAVIRCLSLIGKLHVEMPSEVLQNLQKHYTAIKDLTPDALAKLIRQNAAYKNLSTSDKLHVLTYLCSDGRYYQKVEGLELLPLASGGWTSYKSQRDVVYMCTDEEIEILKGLEKIMVMKPSSLGTPLSHHLDQICSNDLFQIKKLTASDMRQLLETTITNQLGTNPRITQNSKLSFAWLHHTWKYIIEKNYVSHVKNVHIVPVLTAGTWESPESVDLILLSNMLLVRLNNKDELPEGLCRCFENMGVKVIGSLPEWVPREKVKAHFFWPSQKSIIALLTKLGTTESAEETTEIFNARCKWQDKCVLTACLAKCHHILTEEAIEFLTTLTIFRAISTIEDTGTDTALSNTSCYINVKEQFPEGVHFQNPCIAADSSKEALLSTLGARKLELDELVLATLNGFQTEGGQNANEIPKFMDYLINKFHLFQTNPQIINSASNIPFLRAGNKRCKASDLFDPSDCRLQHLLIGDALLPETKKRLSNEKVRILKFLGLKGADDITADIILQVARTLDNMSRENHKDIQCIKKAKSLLDFLHSRGSLLYEKCINGLTLAKCIKTLSCIPVESNRVPPFPDCVHWFSEDKYLCKPSEAVETCMSILVGATKPVVACKSDKVNTEFGWKLSPAVMDVISQLEIVSNAYTVQNRPDIMPMIKAIYEHLVKRHREIWQNRQGLENEKLVWNGSEFVAVNKVIVAQQTNNLDLNPYFCFVPAEFQNMQQLFTSLGCRLQQDFRVLIETLQQIKVVHTTPQEEQTIMRDRNIVCNILDKIALSFKQYLTSNDESEILMMVHDSNPKLLRLYPLSECTYDDDPTCYFEDDENFHLVHEMVSPNTIEALGVKSVTRKALMEAEELGVEEWGQQEPLTTRINALLRDGYTDGLSVPKEVIQNADDAGASVVKFLYDERQNNDAKQRVFSKGMRSFQGPALWIFNDAQFSADDMKNITKLNAATKQKDVRKIGKFGLGFCSVYNLTDMPSFLSGSNLVYFDPHEKHLGNVLRSKGTGLRYKLPNKTLVSRHVDQFRPYSGIFGCKIEQDDFKQYDGTLFRLPLRTEQQAKESRISSVSYTNEEMVTLLRMFVKTAGNFLLFTQNVKKIEIYHLCESATTTSEQKLLYSIERNSVKWDQGVSVSGNENVLARMPKMLETTCDFQEIHKSVIRQTLTENAKDTIPDLDVNADYLQTTWITSWAKGDGKSLQMYKHLSSEGAVPLSAVSVPCVESNVLTITDLENVPFGFYQEGHVFCFLPLPLKTKLQVHINGCFSVTSDRRQLAALTEDDKDSKGNTWNVALMEDSLVKAFLHLIQALANSKMIVDPGYKYYELWPAKCAPVALPFQESFYKAIIDRNINVFKGCQTWVSFQNVVFLDPSIIEGSIGKLAFEILSHFPPRQGKTLIEMPKQVFENIRHSNRSRESYILSAQVHEKEFFLTFLKTLDSEFWNSRQEERNKLILAALKCHSTEVNIEMRKIKCIPSEPNQALARASDLIHPGSHLASLFSDSEEVFPLCTREFRKESTLAKLVNLGMNADFLSSALLINRCESVSALANICGICANERFVNLMRYLSRDLVLREFEKDKFTVEIVADQFMFPILPKPKGWKFSWKAETDSTQVMIYSGDHCCKTHNNVNGTFLFGKSKNLYRQNTTDYVGIVGYVVDESYTFPLKENRKSSERILQLLGIKGLQEVPMDILSEQIMSVSEEYKDKKEQFEDVSRIHDKIFKHLENKMKFSESTKYSIDIPGNCKFVLIGDELLYAQNVAFNLKEEFKPHLYRLPEIDKLNKRTVYTYLGVKQYFSVQVIVEVMKSMKKTGGKVENVETLNNLLINLDEVMQNAGMTYEDLKEFHDDIMAPDICCMLWPTHELVVENEEYRTSLAMKILHPSVTPAIARRLGAKVKQLQCYQEISVGISFGQREELVTRIKGLLKAYPCDSSIMKELLQNADDAGATEIHFVKDYRNHSTEKLFHSSCGDLQGPSLCVYNNSFFTKQDIEGIHNLGQGSKSDDPTKTGQYGVGFNAVYHLTDTPSFVTIGPDDANGGLMFILDPLCKHVPQATAVEPGMMCTITDLETNFSDHMLGFSTQELIKGDIGTVFRFPLRKASSIISEENIDISRLDEILQSFEADIFESVLFLKNVSSIKVSDITSGELVEEYSVQVHLSQKDAKERKTFKDEVDKINKENIKNREKNLNIEAKEVIYEMDVKDTRNNSKRWVIIQRFGIYGAVEHSDEIRQNMRNGDLGLLPSGGVAIQLNGSLIGNISSGEKQTATNLSTGDTKERNKTEVKRNMPFQGRAFCFLPLPISTGLPVHVNGHFALDHEARRDLWKDGYRMRWNTCLLNNVIIPAWISGLSYLCNYITQMLQNANVWQKVNAVLTDYHSLFPTENCTSDTWNDVAKHFYTYVLREQVTLFPCVLDNKCDIPLASSAYSNRERFCILWTKVHATAEVGHGGVYKTVQDEMRIRYDVMSTQKDVSLLIQLLKAFGLKLLETPNKVRLAMVKAGHENVPTSSPSFVISFLKTFIDHSDSSCDVGPVGSHISDTKFITPNNLCVLLDYIFHEKDCYKNMTGLPVLLTADGILRVCSEDSPVFISKYSKLLSKSAQQFVHEGIRFSLLDPKLFQTNIFKKFQFEDFVRLLPTNMDANMFGKGLYIQMKEKENDWDESSPTISQEWLTLFYDFLCEHSIQSSHQDIEQSQKVFDSHQTDRKIDTGMLIENIRLLDTWSFLPCIGIGDRYILIPLKETFHLLFLSALDKLGKPGLSLAKFRLPKLYVKAFSKCTAKTDVQKAMENVVASLNRPYDLLRCLVHHKDVLQTSESKTEDDAIELLAYFGRELNILEKFADKNTLVSLLRTLPLYLTQQGTMTDLAITEEVLVLPKGMPFGGIQIWADVNNITLLQEKESLESIYEFLGLQKADQDYVYAQKILPTFNAIPGQHWMEHVEYLRNKLGHREALTVNQSKILKELKAIAFINVQGVKKRANQLFDQSNVTFKCLVNSNECLPNDMLTSEWRHFLKKLDLKCEVTDEMMVMFARQIELESLNSSMECVRNKSKILLDRFVERNGQDWKINTLSEIRKVKFIEPFVIKDECKNVCPQYCDAGRFICFYDAISCDHSDLCWTSANLLPWKLFNKLSKEVRKQLGIQEKPPVDKVLLHFRNVCDSLKNKLSRGTVHDNFVKSQMSCFYEFFTGCPSLNDQVFSKLRAEPFIHLPDEKAIVVVSEVVVDLPSALEIKPYLYKAPTYYGKYYELFQKIGSKKTIMFCHYASVLQKIKDKCTENEMSVPERAVVKRAFEGLVQLPLDEDTSTKEVLSVFLPTQKMFLKDSKQIIVSNKISFEIRLKGNIELDMCAGESFLDFKVVSLEEVFSKWPDHLKPVLLTDVIKEEVSIEANQRIRYSSKASVIEAFLHSNDLVTGLCRLLKHQSTKETCETKFEAERSETEIANKLQNVTAVEFPTLKTVLKYKGRIVDRSEREINHYIQHENGNMSGPLTFYFNDGSKKANVYIPSILHGLIGLVKMCAGGLNAESIVHVTLLIQSLETPRKIHEVLDHVHIKPYGSPQTQIKDYFPKPGTYVEPQFIPFLEQGISPFKDFEYDHVAMELEDTTLDCKSQFSQSSSAFYENVFKRARSYARAYYENFDAYNRSERTGDYAHSTSTQMKRQDHWEAQRWFRQAKHDYMTASEILPTASGISSFKWVCYICHQACEKALKAAHYSNDANKVPGGVFLPTLALTPEMLVQATLLETRLGTHGRLRYPDALSRPRIPSDMFSKEDADLALSVARTILELVEEYI